MGFRYNTENEVFGAVSHGRCLQIIVFLAKSERMLQEVVNELYRMFNRNMKVSDCKRKVAVSKQASELTIDFVKPYSLGRKHK